MTDNTVSNTAIVVERMFDAPVDLIWQLWTDPEHFAQWYGPHGFTVPVAEMNLEVGGKRRICMEMKTPDNTMQFWTVGAFTTITPPTHLSYTESRADADGNIIVQADDQPTTTQVTIVLEAKGDQTKMTLTHAGIPEGQEGAKGGWEQAFDKLADYIANM